MKPFKAILKNSRALHPEPPLPLPHAAVHRHIKHTLNQHHLIHFTPRRQVSHWQAFQEAVVMLRWETRHVPVRGEGKRTDRKLRKLT